MAVGTTQLRILFLAAGFLLAQGCGKEGPTNRPTGPAVDAVEIICSSLYQRSDSLADALAFIEVPQDRLTSSRASVNRRGEHLADPRQLAFANKLFSLRESRDVELFKSLLSNKTRKQLDEPESNRQVVHYRLREIEDGAFLYGQWDFKFFATFRPLTQDDLDKLGTSVSFAQPPTHTVTFYHFHKPKTMLIGTRCYLIQDADSFRIVTETLLKGELSANREDT